jgi:hypothetical protein
LFIYDICYDIIYDICSFAAADPAPAQRADANDGGHERDAEHGHIDNCKKLANCTNNKDVYLTVLRAHAREGHLQYLRSLEADLADAEQDEGEVAEESASASTVDKECEAGACELGIRYPTLQSIYAGKLNKQSIQANIIYDIIDFL